MDNYNKVRKLLFSNKQIDLKSEKVELGLIDDLKSLQAKSDKLYSGYIGEMDEAKHRLSIAIKSAQKAVEVLTEEAKLRSNVDESAKELGVDLPKEITRRNPQVALEISEKDLKTMQSLHKQFKVR
tara:strand:+ start:737 stop:1114 length:378 start_codon:yes stop_codon:yes gene_type:complete